MGLGSLEKCLVVRNVIKNSRYDICCLQETKWNMYDLSYYMAVFSTYFDHRGAYINARSISGRCIIVWKKNYELLSSWTTINTVTVTLQQMNTGAIMTITNVYGLSVDDCKEFLKELKYLATLVHYPRIIAGDFNIVHWLIDQNGDMRGLTLMNLFNDLFRDQ